MNQNILLPLASIVAGWRPKFVPTAHAAVVAGHAYESERLRGSRFVVVVLRREYDYDGLSTGIDLCGGFTNAADAVCEMQTTCEHRSIRELKARDRQRVPWHVMRAVERTPWCCIDGRSSQIPAMMSKFGDDSGITSIEVWAAAFPISPEHPIDSDFIKLLGYEWELASCLQRKAAKWTATAGLMCSTRLSSPISQLARERD